MHGQAILGLAVLLLLQGCTGEKEESSGCCYYMCESGRSAAYGMWYGGPDACESRSQDSCRISDPADPALFRSEWVPALPGEDEELQSICDAGMPGWYVDATEDTGCCFFLCESDIIDRFGVFMQGEDVCEERAASLCSELDPASPGLSEFEMIGNIPPWRTMEWHCQESPAEFVLDELGDAGCCFVLCAGGHREHVANREWGAEDGPGECEDVAMAACAAADPGSPEVQEFLWAYPLTRWYPDGSMCEDLAPAWYRE
jgi:hypothetical protein